MHTTEICLKDGRRFSGIILEEKVNSEGKFDDSYIKLLKYIDDKPEIFYVHDIKSAITKEERISISKLGDLDVIERMKYYYDIEKKSQAPE
jgi:hypothetical protein